MHHGPNKSTNQQASRLQFVFIDRAEYYYRENRKLSKKTKSTSSPSHLFWAISLINVGKIIFPDSREKILIVLSLVYSKTRFCLAFVSGSFSLDIKNVWNFCHARCRHSIRGGSPRKKYTPVKKVCLAQIFSFETGESFLLFPLKDLCFGHHNQEGFAENIKLQHCFTLRSN